MTHIEIQDLDHDQISEKVRYNLAQRLTRLLDKFEIFLDDDPRDFTPGQISNYLTAVKILGSLYQAHLRPVDKSGMVSVERVEKMIEAARTEAALEAVEAERSRVAEESRRALESAGTGVRDALRRERDRQARALGS
jgi:hypothetical protein